MERDKEALKLTARRLVVWYGRSMVWSTTTVPPSAPGEKEAFRKKDGHNNSRPDYHIIQIRRFRIAATGRVSYSPAFSCMSLYLHVFISDHLHIITVGSVTSSPLFSNINIMLT